jgi:probable FeS assembly SUF system protein SufT
MNTMNTTGTSTVTVARDCEAVAIPSGTAVLVPAGTAVQVVQSFGGAITVRTPLGGLLRIDGTDADAVGIHHPTDPTVDRVETDAAPFSMDRVTDALRQVYDPEIPIDIVELGLVYRCEVQRDAHGRRRIDIDLSMTAPGCGMGEVLRDDVEHVVGDVSGVDEVHVTLVWDPPWGYDRLSETARLRLGLL